jgi:chromate transporter
VHRLGLVADGGNALTSSWWWQGQAGLATGELWQLLLHFTLLSLLAVGGAMTTAPDMQRFVVAQKGWMDEAQFTASVALAQAAPGPNVLFVAVIGFNVAGLPGVIATTVGTLLPSTVLTLAVTRFSDRHAQARPLRAFNAGMAPLTLGLLAATGWVLIEPHVRSTPWPSVIALLATVAFVRWTRLSPMWAVLAGALAGAAGLFG